MTDYLTLPCPRCGGRLCVDLQYPDYVFCDTCPYPEQDERDEQENAGRPPTRKSPFDGLELDVEEADALAAWRGWNIVMKIFAAIGAFVVVTRGAVFLWEFFQKGGAQ